MRYTNDTTPQLQLHYLTTTTTAALHHTTSSSCGGGDHCNHCNHSKKHNSNHFSVHQWIHSAIRDSQQPASPIGVLFWNFRHHRRCGTTGKVIKNPFALWLFPIRWIAMMGEPIKIVGRWSIPTPTFVEHVMSTFSVVIPYVCVLV